MTKQELTNMANNKGLNVFLESDDLYNYIGIQSKKGYVYYWFKSFNDNDYFHFVQRYSQMNGKKSNSFRVGNNFILNLSK
jgi:hypothetical protein